ncbi:MAG: transporter ATP-binding protein [Hyphomicrobiales bacterium]|nr:transporter ATP-binding protein [Hyphomicrobiales bacterium]
MTMTSTAPERALAAPEAPLSIRGLTVVFSGDVTAIDNLSLDIQEGEFVAIVGPSGCGKSTLLKVVSGLVPARSGEVRVGGPAAAGGKPKIGFMFQRDTLLPWATVTSNIAVGCELSGLPKEQHAERIASLIALVRLQGYEDRYPAALSGGMRQRVSLARLLAFEPDMFLMDEPFGALDYQTKIIMGRELLRIWEASRRSIVFVTHDIEEAVALADRVIVMSARPGRIVASHAVEFERPRDPRSLRGDPRFGALVQKIWSELALPG